LGTTIKPTRGKCAGTCEPYGRGSAIDLRSRTDSLDSFHKHRKEVCNLASTTISSSLQATTFRIHLHLWMLVTHIINRQPRHTPAHVCPSMADQGAVPLGMRQRLQCSIACAHQWRIREPCLWACGNACSAASLATLITRRIGRACLFTGYSSGCDRFSFRAEFAAPREHVARTAAGAARIGIGRPRTFELVASPLTITHSTAGD
jgi:hypothetical protein